jgi:hypothetical protein
MSLSILRDSDRVRTPGFRNPGAEWVLLRHKVLRLPVIILLFCILPGMEPEPRHSPPAHADGSGLVRVREDLAAVQVELMQVMRTDPERTCVLQQREEQLKYELRTGFGTPRS